MMQLSASIFADWQTEKAKFDQRGLARPFVTLSFAQSLDGCLAKQSGQKTSLSDQASWAVTHQLRSLHDGILIGLGTLLSDNPLLTVRFYDGPSPRPIILDTHAESPMHARIFHHHPHRAILATASKNKDDLEQRYPGVLHLPVNIQEGRLHLPSLLSSLYAEGITSLMVEGGGQVLSSFLSEALCDFVTINITPSIIGSDSSVRYTIPTHETLDFDAQGFGKIGRDFWTWGHLCRREEKPPLSQHEARSESWHSAFSS